MRTIQIGERKMTDLTEQELIDFMYDFGYCCSPEFFDKPIITLFEKEEKDNTIYFNYYQIRREDGFKIEDEGSISNDLGTRDQPRFGIYLKRFKYYEFGIHQIKHFIKLGFDLPI